MTIQSMPYEVLNLITDQLTPKESAHLGSTCKAFHRWSEQSPRWRHLVAKHFPHKWNALYHTAPATLNFARIYALETAVMRGNTNVSYTLIHLTEDCEQLCVFHKILCVCMLPFKPMFAFFVSEAAGITTILNSPEEDVR